MIPEFENLSEHEVEGMFKAPILVCLLIAGADGRIDRREINEVIKIAEKGQKAQSAMGRYFSHLHADLEDKIMIVIQSYPKDPDEWTRQLVEELSLLNGILEKVDRLFAVEFYAMLREMAQKIASSSGGLLGINSVTAEEARYLELPMLCPPAA